MLGLALAAVASLAEVAAPAPAACPVPPGTLLYHRLSEMPRIVRDDVQRAGPVAEPGEMLSGLENLEDPEPIWRFVLGGQRAGRYFVWLHHHGDMSEYAEVLGYVFVSAAANGPPRAGVLADFTGEPCAGIAAFLNGVATFPRDRGFPHR